MEKSEFTLAATEALHGLSEYFLAHAKHSYASGEAEHYTSILKATVIKCYEFALSIDQQNEDYAYFTLPVLRGICEDFIVEKFIFEQLNEEKEDIVVLLQSHQTLKSSIVQWSYFSKNRPDQRLYYAPDFPAQLEEVTKQVANLIKARLPKVKLNPVLPSVYFMSKQTGLLELYNYLYHATSTFVHFSPGNLFRMGWGKMPDVTFSTAHFKKYYKDFCLYYAILLLSKICEWQNNTGYLPGFNVHAITILNSLLNRASRCPELVTFEEMNIGTLHKHLFFKAPEAEEKNNLLK